MTVEWAQPPKLTETSPVGCIVNAISATKVENMSTDKDLTPSEKRTQLQAARDRLELRSYEYEPLTYEEIDEWEDIEKEDLHIDDRVRAPSPIPHQNRTTQSWS